MSDDVTITEGEEPLRIWWNKNLHGKISPGKLAAHAAHAALHAYGIRYTHPIVVLAAGKGRIEAMDVVIRDEGRTELAPGTVTTGVERRAAERMPEDVQALVDEARELAGKNHLGLKGVRDLGDFLDELADALEAVYSKGAVRCNCGWGGEHDPDNPRCDRNQKGADDDPR